MDEHSNYEEMRTLIVDKAHLLVDFTRRLVNAASPNPPGDTTAVANVAIDLLRTIPGADIRRFETAPGIVNVVARITKGNPGKRLVFSGHLDTYPICEDLGWTVDPLGGALQDGKLYGRGAADMKGGIAASILAARVLAEQPGGFRGEIVIALAGDEETMGVLGTQWLLDNVEETRGDFVICGDAGSPYVVRFGEKGLIWFEVNATGVSAHGAHVHKGVNAIDRLRHALDVISSVKDLPASPPTAVLDAIDQASSISESISGAGESDTLRNVTVNIGTVSGGVLPNLIPAKAQAFGDIRVPLGVNTSEVLEHINKSLEPIQGVQWKTIRCYEATATPSDHALIRTAMRAADIVLGATPPGVVANMRVGASDTRLFRKEGIPSVVVGCTPHNMGGADEYVEIEDLSRVAQIHLLMASILLD